MPRKRKASERLPDADTMPSSIAAFDAMLAQHRERVMGNTRVLWDIWVEVRKAQRKERHDADRCKAELRSFRQWWKKNRLWRDAIEMIVALTDTNCRSLRPLTDLLQQLCVAWFVGEITLGVGFETAEGYVLAIA